MFVKVPRHLKIYPSVTAGMSSTADIVCDLQGFRGKNNEFIVKEAAFISVCGRQSHTFVFAPPYPLSELPSKQRNVAIYLERYGHGIAWEDGHVRYCDICMIFNKMLGKYDTILVKGEEKKNFIKTILWDKDVNVIDMEIYHCPNMKELRKNKCSRKCFYHFFTVDSCANENVRILRDWYVECYKKKSNYPPGEEKMMKKIGEIIRKYNGNGKPSISN